MKNDFIVHELVLDGKGGASPPETLDSTRSANESDLVWLHVEYKHPEVVSWLISQGVDKSAAETLTQQETRPRAIEKNNGTILILRAVNLNPGQDAEDMVSLRIWLSSNKIITLRQRRVASFQDVKVLLENGQGPRTTGEFLVRLIERLADRVEETVDEVDDKISSYEEQSELGQANVRANVSAIRRKTAALRRFLAPQREALDTANRFTKNLLSESETYILREQTDRIIRYVEDLDLAKERAIVLQEEILNHIAQEQNSRTYVLTIVAAIFLPLSFLTGVFGMNVAGLPGTTNTRAFFYLSVGMACLAIGSVLYMRLKKWF